jgi:hypothetical protein
VCVCHILTQTKGFLFIFKLKSEVSNIATVQGQLVGEVEKGPGEGCGLVTYTADLRAVGWGRRVISPRTYQANYCAGTCTFPLTQVS